MKHKAQPHTSSLVRILGMTPWGWLHLMGIDHERLAFKFQGLDQKLTGVVPAKIVQGIIA